MRKGLILLGIIGLYLTILLVIVAQNLSTLSSTLGDPIEQVQTIETTLPNATPELLPDTVFIVHNDAMSEDTVVYQGEVLARGQARLVTNFATGKVMGYTLLRGDGSSELGYDLYHKDGSYWQDCGNLDVEAVLGDYFIGNDRESVKRILSKSPADPDAERIAAELWKVGDHRCAIWNVEGNFMGITGFALLDGDCNVISRLQKNAQQYDLCIDYQDETKVYVALTDDNPCLVNLQTLEVLPYRSVYFIHDGYRVFTTKDGLYDLVDADGTAVVSGSEIAYGLYRENVQYTIDKDGNYHILIGGQEVFQHESVFPRYWDGGLYVTASDNRHAWLYDFEGNLQEEISSEEPDNQVYIDGDRSLLLIRTGKSCRIYTADGSKKTIRGDDNLSLYQLSPASSENPCFVLEHFSDARTRYDLLDADGTVLQGGFNWLEATDVDGVFVARKGFTYGLIDRSGSWLWCERIFESKEEEGTYNHWNYWG